MLFHFVRDHAGTYLQVREAEQGFVPLFIADEFNRFLQCGDIRCGHATLFCVSCGFSHDIAFSCKRRGWCPYCMERRMIDRAEVLTNEVLSDVPIRHWVLSLPPPLRFVLAFDNKLTSAVLAIFLKIIFRHLKWKAKRLFGLESVELAQSGAITAIHRASRSLRVNLHFHCLVTDGVYVIDWDDDTATFRELPPPSRQEIDDIAWKTCLEVRDMLVARNKWRDIPDQTLRDRTIYGHISVGPVSAHRDVRFCTEVSSHSTEDSVERDGAYPFDIWASQHVRAGDRKKRDRLVNYILSPPVTDEQLSLTPDGNMVLEYEGPHRDVMMTRTFEPLDMMDTLASLAPLPRSKLIRSHGVYAPNARLRKKVVPGRPAGTPLPDDEEHAEERRAWAELFARVYPVDIIRCPRCRRRLKLIALKSDRLTYPKHQGVPPDTPPPGSIN